MDKWKNNRGKVVGIGEDSILPPTRRIASTIPPPLLDKRRSKKWSIDGIFKSVFSKPDIQSSSSSFEDLSKRYRRKTKGKPKGASRPSGYAPKSRGGRDYSPAALRTNSNIANNNNNNHNNNNNNNNNNHNNNSSSSNHHYHHHHLHNSTNSTSNNSSCNNSSCNNNNSSSSQIVNGNSINHPETVLPLGNLYSRSSDGSMDVPGRRARKDKVKARVEAKRDRLGASDSSTDESSEDETGRRRHESKKRSSRASRTERYLKRMCSNGGGAPVKQPPLNLQRHAADSRSIESHGYRDGQFQPIDRVPKSDFPQEMTTTGANKVDIQPIPRFDNGLPNGLPNGNYYDQQEESGVNVLIQQTLQYFNDFEKNLATTQNKERKSFPVQNRPLNHRYQGQMNDVPRHAVMETHTWRSSLTPPKPPSRDYRSRLLVNSAPLDKYQHALKFAPRPPEHIPEKENGFFGNPRVSRISPNPEVRNINESLSSGISPTTTVHKYEIPQSPHFSPLKEPPNLALVGSNGALVDRNQSPLLDLNKSKYLGQQSRFSTALQTKDYENSNYTPFKKSESDKPNNRRSLKTLEEAMCELETIYNSLQLADEELLDRAEQRTMEEFHYKGFTASPENFDNEDSSSRRKTWGDPTLGNYKDEPEIPDRLKDDMAYRRMHPKERPSSVDGPSSLCSISYLMTSPIPSRRDTHYIDSKRKPRRKEPDATLDDVVFRSMQYANNTLKVVEPQPPFGIPLGPITTATDSDYLHTRPTRLERERSPYTPNCEPDLVTDDLAFRNLRKDAQLSQQNSSNAASPTPSFGVRKKRAVRSLSANLYGLVNSSSATSALELDSEDQASSFMDSTFDDLINDVPVKRINRRTSDPEVMSVNWQNSAPNCFDVNRNGNAEQPRHRDVLSDIDTSNRSWDESSDDRIRAHERLALEDTKVDYKTNSDKGSSYIASNCGTPSLSPQLEIELITEQEVSVYKKLCQDLENLVQLTKGIDAVPAPNDFRKAQASKEDASVTKLQKIPAMTPMMEEKTVKFNVGEMIDSISKASNPKIDEMVEPSPIKREISTILDNLKKLGEDSMCSNSSCLDRVEKKDEVVGDDKGFTVMTKETCDLATEQSEEEAKPSKERADKDRHAEQEQEQEEEEEEEGEEEAEAEEEEDEEERIDRVDNSMFLRRVQLAKLSGDWKESTPNGVVLNRRTSLTGEANWEGMNKCNHKYNSMPAKTSSLFPFRNYGSKRKSNKRKSMCSVS